MKKISFFILMFFSAPIFCASFNGAWSGSGQALTARSERFCSEVFFEIREDQNSLTIVHGGYRCQDLLAEYPFSRFKKTKTNQLTYKDQVVGGFTQNSFFLDVPDEFYRLDVERLKTGELKTLEVWDDGQSFLEVGGKLNLLD